MLPASRTPRWSAAVPLLLFLALVNLSLVPGFAFRASAAPPAQAGAGATLTILAGQVEVDTAGTGTYEPAQDGQALKAGDAVRTLSDGVALVTFFDGSETQLGNDGDLRIDDATQQRIAVYQSAGSALYHVQPSTTGRTFQASTASAVALVRGTSMVVNVARATRGPSTAPLPPVQFPRVVGDSPYLLTAQAVYPENNSLWEVRSWQDPDSGMTWDTFRRLGDLYPQVGEALFDNADGQLQRVRTFSDPASGTTWDTYENLGRPAPSGMLPEFSAASVGVSAPLGQQDQGSGDYLLASIVLVPDPNGRIGEIRIQPSNPLLPPIVLTRQGDAGAITQNASSTARLAQSSVDQLVEAIRQTTSHGSSEQNQARSQLVEQQIQDIVKTLAPVVVPDAVLHLPPPPPPPPFPSFPPVIPPPPVPPIQIVIERLVIVPPQPPPGLPPLPPIVIEFPRPVIPPGGTIPRGQVGPAWGRSIAETAETQNMPGQLLDGLRALLGHGRA